MVKRRPSLSRKNTAEVMNTVPKIASHQNPAPTASPAPATPQRHAAVVRPRIDVPCLRIAPAPRKPIPLTTCAAILAGSPRSAAIWAILIEVIIMSADPMQTTAWVRIPAGWPLRSRSNPMTVPRASAPARRPTAA